jgi:hypothetical protein
MYPVMKWEGVKHIQAGITTCMRRWVSFTLEFQDIVLVENDGCASIYSTTSTTVNCNG